METKIINEKKNDLFGRREIVISIEANSTPNYSDVGKLISEEFSSPSENIVIKKIKNNFGSKDFFVSFFVYDSEERKNKIEPKAKVKKQ
jgi:ribosomal protein S24E